jgi:hypothetical protein
MTLSLASSCNQDGLLVATSTLAAALLTRCTSPRGISYWLGGAALACVIAAKIAYLPLAGAMLIPLCRDWRVASWRPVLKGVLLTAIPGLLWAAFSISYVASPFVRGQAYHPGNLWPGDPARLFHTTDTNAQLQVFLRNPLLVLSLPVREWRPELIWLRLREMVGVLGQLDVLLPQPLYLLWYMALPVAIVADLIGNDDGPRTPQVGSVIVGTVAIILSCVAIYDVQYLSWTLVGALDIDGVQGRYGLPLLAFLAATVPTFYLTSHRPIFGLIRGILLLPATVAAAIGLVLLPQVTLLTYYLQ